MHQSEYRTTSSSAQFGNFFYKSLLLRTWLWSRQIFVLLQCLYPLGLISKRLFHWCDITPLFNKFEQRSVLDNSVPLLAKIVDVRVEFTKLGIICAFLSGITLRKVMALISEECDLNGPWVWLCFVFAFFDSFDILQIYFYSPLLCLYYCQLRFNTLFYIDFLVFICLCAERLCAHALVLQQLISLVVPSLFEWNGHFKEDILWVLAAFLATIGHSCLRCILVISWWPQSTRW